MSAASVQGRMTLAKHAAVRVFGSSDFHAEHFESMIGPIGRVEAGEVLGVSETLELLATTASFPARTDVDPTPGRYPIPGDASARAPRLLDFTLTRPTDAAIVQYTRETSRPDVAVETTKGDTAPDASADDFEAIEVFVRDVDVFITAHRAELADLAGLETIFETRLGSSIRGRLEHQLVQGDGTGENLTGILAVGVPQVFRDSTASELHYDAVRRGITNVRNTLFDEPNAIAMHPNDWDAILNERDSDGHVVVSGEERVERRIESVPVVPTVAAPEGTPLVGAFDIGCAIRLRSGTSIAISDDHSDYFTKRLVAILATLRATVTVPTPRAFCEVIF